MVDASHIISSFRMPDIATPYELVGGAQRIRQNQLLNSAYQRENDQANQLDQFFNQHYAGSQNPALKSAASMNLGANIPKVDELLSKMDANQLQETIKKNSFVSQQLAPFLNMDPTPENEGYYQQTVKSLESTLGHPLALPSSLQNKQQLAIAYQQGQEMTNKAREFVYMQSTQGIVGLDKTDPYNSVLVPNSEGKPFMPIGADPQNAFNMQAGKEGAKGVDVTYPDNSKGRAPQYQTNPAFMSPGDVGLSNNVGNIRPTGATSGFNSYDSPQAGLQAIDDNLSAYGSKHGINTLSGVISRWAPPDDNNDTQSYITDVSNRIGLDPNQPIDLSDPVTRHAIATGIMIHEKGAKNLYGNGTIRGPSQQQQNEWDLEKKREEAGIANASKKALAEQEKNTSSENILNILDTPIDNKPIEDIIKEATGSGFGSAVDTANRAIGRTTPSAQAAAQLETLSGWLTSNVPRMQGPQSDYDVQNYKTMAGKLGDRTVPMEEKLKALNVLRDISKRQLKSKTSNAGQEWDKTKGPKPGIHWVD